MKDKIIKILSENKEIRAYIAKTTSLVQCAKDVHNTSKTATAALGRVLTANDRISAGRMFTAMKNGEIKKTYVAIVCGVPEPMRGVVDAPIARADVGILMRTVSAEGREARTEYNTVAVSPDGKYSMVVLRPLTGRTHQIRVHMSYIGCPLVGDFLYGERSELIDRHALHAARMTFSHPEDGRSITVSAPLPDDMLALYEKLIRSSDNE